VTAPVAHQGDGALVHRPGWGPAPGVGYPPLDRPRTAARLVGGGLLLAVALALVGLALTRMAALAWVTDWERQVSRWFVGGSTPTWDTLSHVGSVLAETLVCTSVLIVAALLLRWWLGRWRESWALLVALGGELLVFLAVSALVGRERPEVRHLDDAPPTSSFPSGHTGAAVALYGCLAVIVLRQLPWRRLALWLAGLLLLIPVVVALARLYRGMHQLTDVLFGAVNGGVWLAMVVVTLLPVTSGAAVRPRAGPAPRAADRAAPDAAAPDHPASDPSIRARAREAG
jgi:undecaprenyl-diphosphatase